MTSRILIVDDDQEICSLVKTYLERSEFEVEVAYDGRMAKAAAAKAGFDLLLLDVMLPGQSGLDLCRDFRSAGDVPIIMLTAMGQLADKVAGLELGADDYIVKPFEPRELLARARAAVRRKQPASATARSGDEVLVADGLRVNVTARTATARGGSEVPLTFAEFELLSLLLTHANATLSRNRVLQAVFGRAAGLYDRSVDVLMSRLRKKLQAAGANLNVESVRGVGYMLVAQVARA